MINNAADQFLLSDDTYRGAVVEAAFTDIWQASPDELCNNLICAEYKRPNARWRQR